MRTLDVLAHELGSALVSSQPSTHAADRRTEQRVHAREAVATPPRRAHRRARRARMMTRIYCLFPSRLRRARCTAASLAAAQQPAPSSAQLRPAPASSSARQWCTGACVRRARIRPCKVSPLDPCARTVRGGRRARVCATLCQRDGRMRPSSAALIPSTRPAASAPPWSGSQRSSRRGSGPCTSRGTSGRCCRALRPA